jgi:hypothetical protein
MPSTGGSHHAQPTFKCQGEEPVLISDCCTSAQPKNLSPEFSYDGGSSSWHFVCMISLSAVYADGVQG